MTLTTTTFFTTIPRKETRLQTNYQHKPQKSMERYEKNPIAWGTSKQNTNIWGTSKQNTNIKSDKSDKSLSSSNVLSNSNSFAPNCHATRVPALVGSHWVKVFRSSRPKMEPGKLLRRKAEKGHVLYTKTSWCLTKQI